jgi:hypothetical protein
LTGKAYEEAQNSFDFDSSNESGAETLWAKGENGKKQGQKNGKGKFGQTRGYGGETLGGSFESLSKAVKRERKSEECARLVNLFIAISTFLLLIFTIWFHANHTAGPIM